VNLVLNSIQATKAGGVIEVGVRNAMMSPRHSLHGFEEPYGCIDVVDQGGGIRTELLSKIFDPFVSSKPAGEGTGLGLTVAKGIATEHDGWIDVHSEFGRGSHFTVYVPRGRSATSCTLR
jgi:two-component system, NtrC family, sensor kinase